MAESNFRGPVTNMGALEVDAATAAVQPFDGPNVSYQGQSMPDLRSVPFAKDGMLPGRQLSVMIGQSVWAIDTVPQARSSTQIAAASANTSAVNVSLATVGVAGVASAANIAVGVPIIPIGTTVVTTVIAIDFGFTTGTTTANSSTIAVIDNTLFRLGQWVIVGNVGNTAATQSLITQVQSIATTNLTTITVSPSPATALSNVPIGQANLYGSALLPPAASFGPAAASANAHAFGGAIEAGLSRVINPRETSSRNISLFASTIATHSATVFGWDLWGNPMTELLSLTNQTTSAGKKAFKYIGRIVPGTSGGATTFAYGLGDSIGFPFRADEWDQTEITYNNLTDTNSNGFTAAVLTSPSTNTSGDVRGTIQLSTSIVTGVLATSITGNTTSNGTSRLTVQQNIGVWNMIYGTPVNTAPMFGVAQSTT